MSENIEKYISQSNFLQALKECISEKQYNLGILISNFWADNSSKKYELTSEMYKTQTDMKTSTEKEKLPTILEIQPDDNIDTPVYKVLMYCNWCESKELCDLWNKMSKGNYRWNNIEIVYHEPADYIVVINCPPITIFPEPKKTILFHMEPNMKENKYMWGDWGNPPKGLLKYCGTHENFYNNIEWHLSKNYYELSENEIIKDETVCGILSTVLSDKYKDPGHIKRIDFVKFLEKKGMNTHVFGNNKFDWKNYKGSLPYHKKDDAMFPYKYVFNAENHQIRNYFTEKFVDAILAECLIFYYGCPNIKDFFDERAFVYLELDNFEKDFQTIKFSISNNLWEKRLPYIKEVKRKILNEMQFFPRLESIINST